MTSGGGKGVAIRLSVKDAETVRATLERLGRDGDASIRKIDRAARETTQGVDALGSGLGRLRSAAGALGVGLTLGALTSFARGAIDAAGGLGEMAEQLGVTTDQLQVYQYAATQVGVKQVELDAGLQRLARTIGEAAQGNDAAIDTFERLGIRILDAAGRTRASGEILAEFSERLREMPDDAARAAAAYDLLGRSGQRLIPLLSGGAEALSRYEAEARKAGLVWSAETIARADQMGDRLAALELEAKKFAQTLVLEGGLLDGLESLMAFLNGDKITNTDRLSGFLKSTREEIELIQKAYEWLNQRGIAADRERERQSGSGPIPIGPYKITHHDASADLVAASRALGAPAGGSSNARRQSEIEAEKKLAEQIARTTEELARQNEQYGRAAELRASFEALARAGIKISEEELVAARQRVAADADAASARDRAIVQIADLAAGNHRKAEAEKAGTQAQREAEAQQKRLTEAQAKASQALDTMLADLKEEQYQLRLSERERYIRQIGLEAEKKAIEAGLSPQDARIERLKREAAATYDVREATRQADHARQEFEREAQRQAEAQRELLLEPYREAWRSIQQLGAQALDQLFDGGLKKASDFWEAFKRIALRALAQIAAAEITVAIQGVFGTGGLNIGSLFGGGFGGGGIGGGGTPFAGTQNLGGGLFGNGGIGSFLSRPLHGFGIGSPGLDPTGASAYLGLPESGGIGGFIGNLSVGQALGVLGGLAGGAFQIAQGGTANMIGGITSLIGAGVSLIPGVGQVLGPLMAIAGPLLGGLFGGPKKKPRKSLQLLTTSGGMDGFERGGATAITPFGTLGYNRLGTNQQFVKTEYSAALIKQVAEIDRAIAALLTQEQIASVSAALQSYTPNQENYRNNPDREAFDVTKNRLEQMLRTLYGGQVATQGLAGIARSDQNIGELVNRAGEIIQLKNAIEKFGKETTAAEEAVRSLNAQFNEMAQKARDYGFSAADLARIEQERRRQINRIASDFNDGIRLALLGMDNPFSAAMEALEKDQARRLAEAQYLNTVSDVLVDIVELEKLFGRERLALAEQFLAQYGSAWADFERQLLFGPLSARSNREQYEMAMAQYRDVQGRASAAYANDNLDPALAGEFQREALAALTWSRAYMASSAQTAALYEEILALARQFGDIPGFASGGMAGPGWAMVGEKGAELIRLFQPARVYSHDDSMRLLRPPGSALDAQQMRAALREAIGELIHNLAGQNGNLAALLAALINRLETELRDRRLRDAGQTARPRARRGAAA